MLGQNNHVNFCEGWCKISLNLIHNAWVYAGTTFKYRFGIPILPVAYVRYHDGVVQVLLDTDGFHTQERLQKQQF